MDQLQLEVLDPVGVRATGVSLAEPTDDLWAELRRLLAEHGVVVLPGQRIDDDAFLAFLRGFGDLAFTAGRRRCPATPTSTSSATSVARPRR